MKKFLYLIFLPALILSFTESAFARSNRSQSYHGYHSGRSYKSHSYQSRSYYSHKSNYAQGVKRDHYGHIKRNPQAKRQFMKETGYPKGRPGYVVDHIVPLKRGGADHLSNMQWQTKEAAKAKDRWE